MLNAKLHEVLKPLEVYEMGMVGNVTAQKWKCWKPNRAKNGSVIYIDIIYNFFKNKLKHNLLEKKNETCKTRSMLTLINR